MVEQLVLTGIMLTLVGCLFGTRINPAWLFVSAIGTSYLAGLIDLENMLVNYANPSLITLVLLVLVSILLVGGESTQGFAIALIIGVVVGTYSSIYIASNVILMMNVTREDLMIPIKEGSELDDIP